jgi:demethylmenaquinone methyltransferase/2-methoxy-6-polyprenyl-1,4-benzoquinol methylase
LSVPASAPDTPRRIFSPIASNYDRPAQLLSLLQYRRWHDFLLSRLSLPPGSRVLDMATGTGALARRLCQRRDLRVAAADVTRQMLEEAGSLTAELGDSRPDLIECTAEAAPFADAAFDAVVFTYLLRYVSDVPGTLTELARVVRPGGAMASLEFAVPSGPWHPLWRLYTAVGLPLGGAVLSPAWRRVGAFLGPSIRDFYRRWPEERLLELWRQAGFPDVRKKRLSLGGAVVMWGAKAA